MKNSQQKDSPRISVVLNTCNRGAYIGDTLRGLQRQSYDNFEVIVVNGPSIDNTEDVVKDFEVKYYTAPFNLSISRNIGIKHASGDIIAFIDDDAVPEANWLADLVKAYEDPKVAAAGGRVFNADGSGFQFSYGAIDVWGYPVTRDDKPYEYNDPAGDWFNVNIGTNASYRREPLIEVGGFDEEIEYYHDESDVCVRLIQAGYKVAQLENAYVHHKMAPSFRRKNSKKTVVWDAIVKNTIYFGLLNTAGKRPLHQRLSKPFLAERQKLSFPYKLFRSGDFTFGEGVSRHFALCRAFMRGYRRGFSGKRKLMQGYIYEPDTFLRYKKIQKPATVRHIVLVSQGFPPHQTDGIARYTGVLAKELSRLGHTVSVVSRALNENKKGTIQFIDGAWLYRHQPNKYLTRTTGYPRVDHQLAHARSVLATVRKIHDREKVDVVLAPLWDAEGLGLMVHKVAPTILTLMSPLKKVVETQWFNVDEPSYDITYELERECVVRADGIMAISDNIKHTIGELYNVDWRTLAARGAPTVTLPLGVGPEFITARKGWEVWAARQRYDAPVEILYVGRAERRKGTDVLLAALPKMLSEIPNARIKFVGDEDGKDEKGKSYFAEFRKKYSNQSWFKRVAFVGRVSDEDLADAYKACDIFVAPSRYESFGQIYIEAMAAGKPVVGTRAGGIPEVVQHEVNGFLIENENSEQLADYLIKLASDSKLRVKMGEASLRIAREKFAGDVLAKDFLKLVDQVIDVKESS